MKSVVIFGGSGFIGHNIIQRIARNGYKIIVPYQRSINETKLKLLGSVGQIIPIKFENIQDVEIIKSIKNTDIIINLKTLWKGNSLSFQKKIKKFNIDLIFLLNKLNMNKSFIFFTGLGIDKDSTSIRTRTIAETEEYINKNYANSFIIRPGIILGGGDQFLKKLLPIIKISFFVPIFGSGEKKFQPVYVGDVAKAVENIIQSRLKGNHTFELVGTEIFTYRSFYTYLFKCLKVKRYLFPIPFFLAKLGVFIIEKMQIELISLEQLELFNNNSLPSNIYKKFSDLNIKPQDVRKIVNNFIIKK